MPSAENGQHGLSPAASWTSDSGFLASLRTDSLSLSLPPSLPRSLSLSLSVTLPPINAPSVTAAGSPRKYSWQGGEINKAAKGLFRLAQLTGGNLEFFLPIGGCARFVSRARLVRFEHVRTAFGMRVT